MVAMASKRGTCACVRMTVTTLVLGLFMLYESFPQLKVGLRGFVYY